MRKRFLHIILILCVTTVVIGQSTQSADPVSKTEFNEFNEQLDYDKTDNKLRWKKAKKTPKKARKKKEVKPRSAPNFGFLSGLGSAFQMIAYLLIAVMIGVIIYIIFSNVQVDKNLPNQEYKEIDLEEEHIEDVDVESEYERAVRLGDYRLALRMKFLMILKQLSINNDIDWKYEKTNRDYASELRGTDLYKGFKNISGVFEWVWYGNYPITKDEFDYYEVTFNEFNPETV